MISKLVRGSVWDVNVFTLLKHCHFIEPRLYFKWNAEKFNRTLGRPGTWELWIKPDKKTAVHVGDNIFELKFVETKLLNHVKDFDILSYKILDWLYEHDTFSNKHYLDDFEYQEEKGMERLEQKNREELKYQIRSDKNHLSYLKDEFLSKRVNIGKIIGS